MATDQQIYTAIDAAFQTAAQRHKLYNRGEARDWANTRMEGLLDALDRLRDEILHNPHGWASTDAAIACHAAYGALFATDALEGEIASIREEREG